MQHYVDLALTPAIAARQRRRGAVGVGADERSAPTGLPRDVVTFLGERDSFYLATTSETGWPYVQHRGGSPGFVRVLGPATIGWIERPGNRQYLTAGHLDTDCRVALIAVDYPTRRRLKLLGRATYVDEPSPDQLERLAPVDGRVDAVVTVEVAAVDWNCPKHITPRYTPEQVASLQQHLLDRIAELESELAAVRAGASTG